MEKRLSILRINLLFLGLAIGLVGWAAGRFERTLSGAWYPAALVISGVTLAVIGFIFPLRSRLHRISALGFSILMAATLIYGISNLLPTVRMILEQKALREMVDDPLLDHRGMPNASGNDANGFRNDGVPNPMDIVAIGDSQTWGSNADRYQTWPAALAQISNRSVYNAAYGGYGAVQHRTLAQELVSSQPRLMVIGLYFGNDLFDAYNMVYNRDVYADLRSDSADTVLLDDSIVSRVSGLTRGISQMRTDFYRAHYFVPLANLMLAVDWSFDADYAWAEANPEDGAVYDQNGLRSVFVRNYQLGLKKMVGTLGQRTRDLTPWSCALSASTALYSDFNARTEVLRVYGNTLSWVSFFKLVRDGGLEPPRLTTPGFKSSAATDFANPAIPFFSYSSVVRTRGLEPPRDFSLGDLNAARLPNFATSANSI